MAGPASLVSINRVVFDAIQDTPKMGAHDFAALADSGSIKGLHAGLGLRREVSDADSLTELSHTLLRNNERGEVRDILFHGLAGRKARALLDTRWRCHKSLRRRP